MGIGLIAVLLSCGFSSGTVFAEPANPPDAGAPAPLRTQGKTREIDEALQVTGQARNLSMGLMFSRENDKIEFGTPRTHYKDKISPETENY